MTFRDAFNSYIRELGKDPDRVWDGIRETIRQTLLTKQTEFGPLHAKYSTYWSVPTPGLKTRLIEQR